MVQHRWRRHSLAKRKKIRKKIPRGFEFLSSPREVNFIFVVVGVGGNKVSLPSDLAGKIFLRSCFVVSKTDSWREITAGATIGRSVLQQFWKPSYLDALLPLLLSPFGGFFYLPNESSSPRWQHHSFTLFKPPQLKHVFPSVNESQSSLELNHGNSLSNWDRCVRWSRS